VLFRQTLGVAHGAPPGVGGSYAHHMAQVEIVREFFAGATLSAVSDVSVHRALRGDDVRDHARGRPGA